MNEQRALLDQLMGKTRDVPEALKSTLKELKFSDRAVCKYALCGLCPFATFVSTKSDMGPCRSELCDSEEVAELSRKYLSLDRSERDRYGYEYDLMRSLEGIVQTCDQAIARKTQRADRVEAIPEEILLKIAEIDAEIKEMNEKCVAAAEEGDIDLSQEYAKKIEILKDTSDKLATPTTRASTVCEVSGNIISTKDNNDRMRAHFEGKQYLGWKRVRDKLVELKAMNLCHPSSVRRGDGRERRMDSNRRSRSRSRDKIRDRQQGERDGDRNRDRDRGERGFGRGDDRSGRDVRKYDNNGNNNNNNHNIVGNRDRSTSVGDRMDSKPREMARVGSSPNKQNGMQPQLYHSPRTGLISSQAISPLIHRSGIPVAANELEDGEEVE